MRECFPYVVLRRVSSWRFPFIGALLLSGVQGEGAEVRRLGGTFMGLTVTLRGLKKDEAGREGRPGGRKNEIECKGRNGKANRGTMQ